MKASISHDDTSSTSSSLDPAAVAVRILLSVEEIAFLLGVGKRRAEDLLAEPSMPKPIQLGPRILRWRRAELEEAVANLPRKFERTVPAELARARVDRMKSGAQ